MEPPDDLPYTIFAQSLDRSGFARGTLAPRQGLQAIIPPLDPRPLLSMADMGMGHDMGGMSNMGDMNGTDHSAMPMSHDMTNMGDSGMDHSSMPMGHDMAGMEIRMDDIPGMDHGSGQTGQIAVKHSASESVPGVDAQVVNAKNTLSDPGVGLRDNGRRVLTYADLHTLGGPIDPRPPGREIELHLTGHMKRFMWSFDGKKFSEAEALKFVHGERLRIVLVNDSMMTHPIHLHGMWSELESPDGAFQVRKHTILVQPAQRVSYLVTADALGRWAYHCHLLFHMEAGMFREVIVAPGPHPAMGG